MASVRTLAALVGCLAAAAPAEANFWWFKQSAPKTACPPGQDLWCGFCYSIPVCSTGLVWKGWRYGCQNPEFVAPTYGAWGWPQRQQTQNTDAVASSAVIPTGVAAFTEDNMQAVVPASVPVPVSTRTRTRRPRITRTRVFSAVMTGGEQWQTLSIVAPTGVVYFPSGNVVTNTPSAATAVRPSLIRPKPTSIAFTPQAEVTLSVVPPPEPPAPTPTPTPVPTTMATATRTGGGGFIVSVIPNSVLENAESVAKTTASPSTVAQTTTPSPAPVPPANTPEFNGPGAAGIDEEENPGMNPPTVEATPQGCPVGYDGPDCADINECLLGTNNCSPDASCRNAIGSFTCKCGNGYAGDGVTCVNILGVDAR